MGAATFDPRRAPGAADLDRSRPRRSARRLRAAARLEQLSDPRPQQADSVGRNVSHGCLHIYPEDIALLFKEVPVGTQVRVVSQAVAAGWINNRLYVQVHPNKEQADEIDYNQPMTPAVPAELMRRVSAAAGSRADLVDWAAVRMAGLAASGIPTPVTPRVDDLQASR
jgi:hypothetical protein